MKRLLMANVHLACDRLVEEKAVLANRSLLSVEVSIGKHAVSFCVLCAASF